MTRSSSKWFLIHAVELKVTLVCLQHCYNLQGVMMQLNSCSVHFETFALLLETWPALWLTLVISDILHVSERMQIQPKIIFTLNKDFFPVCPKFPTAFFCSLTERHRVFSRSPDGYLGNLLRLPSILIQKWCQSSEKQEKCYFLVFTLITFQQHDFSVVVNH